MHCSRRFVHLPPIIYLTALASLAIGVLGGCAALELRKRDSTLPIYSQPSGFGQIQASAWESDSHLYVSGTFHKAFGTHHPHDLIVCIFLEDAGGRILQTAEDRIPPTSPSRAASGRASHSFVAKFPLSEISQASAIRVRLQRGGEL